MSEKMLKFVNTKGQTPEKLSPSQRVKNFSEIYKNYIAPKAEEQAIELLRSKGWRPDYLVVCRHSDLQRAQPGDEHLVILAAAWLGGTRLIDNFVF